MPITTTTVMPPAVQQSFSGKLLSVPTPSLIHKLPAMRKKMPAHGGDTLRMKRYNKLATAPVPLGNMGIEPPAQVLSAIFIDAKIDFYGSYVMINEQVSLQIEDPVINAATERLGVSLRETEDELTRDMLRATAGAINCVGGGNGDNPTEITDFDVGEVIATLFTNDAYTILDNIQGANKFGTAPVHDSFFAMCHTQLTRDLRNTVGFTHKNNYPNQTRTLRSEYGSIDALRFFISSKGSITANSSGAGDDVYNIFCCGMEAYACIEQDMYSASFIYRPPIYDGPLALNCSVGYKFAEVPRITNDLWILNLRATLA